jgi:hypothetical protein
MNDRMGDTGKRIKRGFACPAAVDGCRWIELGHGRFTLIDESCFPLTSERTWYFSPNGKDRSGYVVSKINGRHVKLHRLLTEAKPGEVVDHINGDPLDNRMANLRVTNQTNNTTNRHGVVGRKSPYKGVVCKPDMKKPWRSRIVVSGKDVYLGFFDTAEEAARVYDEAARRFHGAFARLNFPRPGEQSATRR